ncbi:hypothetical protein [Paraburkholderia tropica]|uniref:hypothetical protein n=1 Tax=Paraburkholderia tropica TaxID=92647 RepID=UPI0015917B25|nr:hypothetical protein [Paraburkholderia tropica]
MANNLFITYDLRASNGEQRDYQSVFDVIHGLGNAKHLELSQFYVKTQLSAEEAAKRIWTKMRAGGRLMFVDSTTNNGYWCGLSAETTAFLQQQWYL